MRFRTTYGKPRWDRYEAYHPALVIWLKYKNKFSDSGLRKPSYDISIEQYRKDAEHVDKFYEWVEEYKVGLRYCASL